VFWQVAATPAPAAAAPRAAVITEAAGAAAAGGGGGGGEEEEEEEEEGDGLPSWEECSVRGQWEKDDARCDSEKELFDVMELSWVFSQAAKLLRSVEIQQVRARVRSLASSAFGALLLQPLTTLSTALLRGSKRAPQTPIAGAPGTLRDISRAADRGAARSSAGHVCVMDAM